MFSFIKSRKTSGLLVAAIAFMASQSAHAVPGVPSFGLLGGVNMSSASASATLPQTAPTVGGGTGWMGGLGITMGLGIVGIDANVLYAHRAWTVTSVEKAANNLYIPVMLDFGMGPVMLEVGGYYSMMMGEPTSAGVASTAAAEYMSTSDYGIVAGLGAKFMGFSVEARYNFGLANQSTATLVTVNNRHIDLLVGYWFF